MPKAKLATTAFGEAFSDFIFFNDYIGRNLAILMGLAFLIICLAIQFRTRKYVPWIYWLAVTAVSIFGTMSADFLNKDLGMPLYASTLMLLGFQAAVFIAWYASQKTLDVHSINTRLRELFYWLTVIFTFARGTAAGDFAAGPLGLGTLASTFVFLAVILVPAAGYKWMRLNEVLAFWFAYTITRPLGASFADWLSVPAPYGDGLQLGTGPGGRHERRPLVGRRLCPGGAGRLPVVDGLMALCPVSENDLALLQRLYGDPLDSGEHEWHGWQDTRWLRREWEENGLLGEDGGTLMARKGDDTLGFVAWRRRSYGPHSPCWIVSIGLKPEARGHGHGTEAQRQLTRYLFAHTRANRIEAGTEITNVGEQRALEKAGFTREGVLRGALFRRGQWHDCVFYGILRHEVDLGSGEPAPV